MSTGAQPLAGSESEAGVALGRRAQPGLGDLCERDRARRTGGVQPQHPGPPEVAGELVLGVGALGQILQMLVGVAQLADGARPGSSASRCDGFGHPVLNGPLEQRGGLRGGQQRDQLVDHHRDQRHAMLVVALLDRVGDLETQLQREIP
jgi:hypothetical protein